MAECQWHFQHQRRVSVSPDSTIPISHIQNDVIRIRNNVRRGTWPVERRSPISRVIRHLGVSYASLLAVVGLKRTWDQKLSYYFVVARIRTVRLQHPSWEWGPVASTTSHQFGERLHVHVEERWANEWRVCVQCCSSHSGHVPRFVSVRELCTRRTLLPRILPTS